MKINVFMINSNNQELIHHIHCLGYVFYQSCQFYRFLLYKFYFGFYLFNPSNIFDSAKYLYLLLSSKKNEYIFGFSPTNLAIAALSISCFILPTTNLFDSP